MEEQLIRTEVKSSEIMIRGGGTAPGSLAGIRKSLRAFHTLEVMAAALYRFQAGRRHPELRPHLIRAMANEMTHVQDFQIKLGEYGFRPSILRLPYWLAGWCLGTFSGLLGRKMILRTGIWAETKAVRHYSELLKSVEWDEDSRRVIEKDLRDEEGHIRMWRSLR
jgi:demethoxyubiquinone hydroxylase (CLK1/Coq7/Cat5 family)